MPPTDDPDLRNHAVIPGPLRSIWLWSVLPLALLAVVALWVAGTNLHAPQTTLPATDVARGERHWVVGESLEGRILPPSDSVTDLEKTFDRYQYYLDGYHRGTGTGDEGDRARLNQDRKEGDIPRLFVSRFPPDIGEMVEVPRRKSLFIRALLPLVLAENEATLEKRRRLEGIRDHLNRGLTLSLTDRKWLAGILTYYKVRTRDLDELLRRLDAVPVSLALAQAAVESGWGTSRFAREGNALYGQWTWSRKAPGIVPVNRPRGTRHRIRAFPDLAGAVRAYMHALNASWAYRAFRTARDDRRRRGLHLDGPALVNGLRMYSQEREVYTARLRRLIATNELQRLDLMRLQPSTVQSQSVPKRLVAFLTNFIPSL